MKNLRKSMVMVVVAFTLMLTGCGGAAVMKEFTSEDETVSIQMNEKWTVQDMGAGSEGWVAAASANGAEAIIVMQMAKSIYGTIDMDDWRDLINDSYSVSGAETITNPSVPGMEVVETYSCTVTADGVKGDGRVLYGETDYAYYNILYVAAKINDARDEYFKNVCASFKETAPDIDDLSSIERTDTVQWFNNTCAVLTAVNNWDYRLFGGAPANENTQTIVEELLSSWWDVTDRQSADETMDWLLEGGHRVSFAEDMESLAETGIADASGEERVNFILDNFEMDEEDAQNYADWYALYEQSGADAIAGWDYCRAMSLLGYYYLAGYYTEEEALDKSLEVAKTIQNTFDSWDALMDSYLVGYEYWSEEDSAERRGIYEDIKAEADSPYNLDWGMTLEKTW